MGRQLTLYNTDKTRGTRDEGERGGIINTNRVGSARSDPNRLRVHASKSSSSWRCSKPSFCNGAVPSMIGTGGGRAAAFEAIESGLARGVADAKAND